jgi:RND superfamily putative drug exporter
MRFVRRFAVPILIAWLLLTVALNVLVPPIESVARNHAVTMSPQDAPAMIAAKRIGAQFHESNSDSIAMVVLESDQQLGEEAHRYYDGLVKKLQADPKHLQHVQNVWGDPLTAAGVQSHLRKRVRQSGTGDRRQINAARRAQGIRNWSGGPDHRHERGRR